MTARTSQVLADKLRAAGAEELAVRAELDEFHDFRSPHDLPEMVLNMELIAIINNNDKYSPETRAAVKKIHTEFMDGLFDADLKESDEWAHSLDGHRAFAELLKK